MNIFSPFDLNKFRCFSQHQKLIQKTPNFEADTLRLACALPPNSKIILWFKQSHFFIQALIAAWKSKSEVFILSDISDTNKLWAEQQDFCLTDDPSLELAIPCYLISDLDWQKVRFIVDMQQGISLTSVLWLKTSGSTGAPKIIRKTLWQFKSEAEMLKKHFNISERYLILNSVSQQHLYGLTFCIMLPLFSYAAISSNQLLFPELVAEYAKASDQPIIWIASPMLLRHFTESYPWSVFKQKIHCIFSAGGPLSEKTSLLFTDNQIVINEIYGSTETGVIATRQGFGDWEKVETVIFERQRDKISVCSQWLPKPEILSDLLEFTDENHFVLRGRMDRILKLADKRISLHQIEQHLEDSPLVDECHCFKHPEKTRLISLICLTDEGIKVLREYGRKALTDRLAGWTKEALGAVATPRFWRFVARIPRNSQGKIVKSEALKLFEDKPRQPEWQGDFTAFDLNQSETRHFTAVIPVDLYYFSGHFLTFPLVPGVVQLQWAVQLAVRLGIRSAVLKIENLKYQQFTRPNDRVNLSLSWNSHKQKLSFVLTKIEREENLVCGSGRIVFGV